MFQRVFFFFFNDTATTEIYTLSLHDALPIWADEGREEGRHLMNLRTVVAALVAALLLLARPVPRSSASPRQQDRKSTRLNSSHANISYAVFCLKKKKKHNSPK